MKPYFTLGIPIFKYQTEYAESVKPDINPQLLEESLPDDNYVPIKFHAFSGTLFGFREAFKSSFGSNTYTPIMHGLLEVLNDRKILVVGYANWFTVFFSLSFIITPFLVTTPQLITYLFPIFLLIILTWIYFIQSKRFKKVAEIAASLINSGKDSAPN